jgi:hypothetical protein
MKRGFTLIETLIYLGLYAIVIGGMLASVRAMVESNARNETVAMVEEEGDYLTAKIDWTLSQAISVQAPLSSGDMLSVTMLDGSSISISDEAAALCIRSGGAPAQVLSNSNVSIIGLTFIHALSTSDGMDPESVSASFTMQATTSDGHAIRRDFSTLYYLRK